MWLFCLLDPGQIRYRAIYTHPNQIPGYASGTYNIHYTFISTTTEGVFSAIRAVYTFHVSRAAQDDSADLVYAFAAYALRSRARRPSDACVCASVPRVQG